MSSDQASGAQLIELETRIPVGQNRWVHATRGVSLGFPAGTVTAVVGESGCGKSMLARALIADLPAGTRVRGQVRVGGVNLVGADSRTLNGLRGRSVGLVPQSATTFLTPTLTVGDHLTETFRHHGMDPDVSCRLAAVGLDVSVAGAFPHELSGGMAQRVQVALVCGLEPSVLVADEPTSALDTDLAEAIVSLITARAAAGAAVVMVTHDLIGTRHQADRVAVLHAGSLLEVGPAERVLTEPAHSYSRVLLDALPEGGLQPAPGSPASLVDPPEGLCLWHRRLGLDFPMQPMVEVGPGHLVAPQHPDVEAAVAAVRADSGVSLRREVAAVGAGQ